MMRVAFIAFCFAGFAAAAPGPLVRASIATPRPIIVGQAVRVNVTVLAPNYFLGEPEFPQININNAIVVLPGETPQNSSETIGGQTYAGITVTYLIYPQQPGTFKLPTAEIAVKYASDPPKSAEVHLTLPAITFDAMIPPEAADLNYFLPTTALKISQILDKPLKHLQVGDTVTRTIAITASKMRAMLIPPTKFDAPDGIAVYPKEPKVDDIKTDRGEFVEGRRVDTVTYLIRKDGGYTLPPVQVEWWNLDRRRVETATLPAIQFEATPNPAAALEFPPEPEPVIQTTAPKPNRFKHYLRLTEVTAILLIALALLLWAWF
ncbi:MAG TPA: BatD family protein, partial [Bryobacteraceae bacterium]